MSYVIVKQWMERLRDLMNQIDPSGDWYVDEKNKTICRRKEGAMQGTHTCPPPGNC